MGIEQCLPAARLSSKGSVKCGYVFALLTKISKSVDEKMVIRDNNLYVVKELQMRQSEYPGGASSITGRAEE